MKMKHFVILRWSLAWLALTAAASGTWAREPGIAPNLPPGLTLGLPIAVSPPPGWYFINRLSYAAYTLRDDNGNYNGQKSTVIAESLQLSWVPETKVLGASYKAFIMVPLIDVEMERTTTATGRLGSWHDTGLANPKVQTFDLSWILGNGWHAGTGVGFYAPLGDYNKGAQLNIAGNFWTLEPSVGLTYLHDGLHFSAHLIYNTNTKNPDNQYRSGDQVFTNLTLTQSFAGWNVGPVAYYQEQVTPDSNGGGRATFGGRVFPDPMQIGAGLLVSTQWGKVRLYAMATRDFEARNTMAGNKLWFNFSFPL